MLLIKPLETRVACHSAVLRLKANPNIRQPFIPSLSLLASAPLTSPPPALSAAPALEEEGEGSWPKVCHSGCCGCQIYRAVRLHEVIVILGSVAFRMY
jgi:hypothetical protein